MFARPVPKVAVDFLLQPHVPGLRLDEVLQPLVNARLVYLERGRDGQPTTLGLHRIDRDFLYQRLPAEGLYSRTALHSRAAEFSRTQRTATRGDGTISLTCNRRSSSTNISSSPASTTPRRSSWVNTPSSIGHCGHPTYCRDLYLKLPDRLTSDRARVCHVLTALVWKAYLGPVFEGLKAGEHALDWPWRWETCRWSCWCAGIGRRVSVRQRQRALARARRTHRRARRRHCPRRWRTTGDHRRPTWILVLAYTYQGDVRRAAPLARAGYDIARRSQNPALIAAALNGLAVLYFAWGRYADAVRIGGEAEAVWKPNFHDGIAYVKNIIGMSHYLLGDYPAAVTKLGEALTTADEWDSPRPAALAQWNLP